MIKKTILVLSGIVTVLIIIFFIYINSGVLLPQGTDEVIDEILQSGHRELVKGKTGRAKSGETEIWYECINTTDKPKATVLLIMGIGSTALLWPEYFIWPIANSGYQVVRFDNRGSGMSDWMENWDEDNPYTLEDMAKDGIAVLDDLGVEKAHIIGASMGGMIAQHMAINHPERILSLTSVMSSGYIEDPDLPGIPKQFQKDFFKLVLRYGILKSERNTIKLSLGAHQLIKGDAGHTIDIKGIAETVLYELRRRRGYNPDTVKQHLAATSVSSSRYDKLGKINVPALVIHGKSDPLVPFAHAKKYAPMIPNADTLWIEGMGHELHRKFLPEILDGIFKVFQLGGGSIPKK